MNHFLVSFYRKEIKRGQAIKGEIQYEEGLGSSINYTYHELADEHIIATSTLLIIFQENLVRHIAHHILNSRPRFLR